MSSDQKVATVSAKGVVTAKMPGKTTIMVKAKDRNIISSKLTVIVLPKKMADTESEFFKQKAESDLYKAKWSFWISGSIWLKKEFQEM